MTTHKIGAFVRLELAESIRSKWAIATLLLYAAVFAAFVGIGLRESTILGFTGLSRAMLGVTNALLLALPLLVLLATSQVVVRARRSGLLEMLLSQPARRSQWFIGVVASRLVVLLAPLLLMLVIVPLATRWLGEEEGLATVLLRSTAIAAALVWAYLGVGLWLSSAVRTPERAIVSALAIWLVVSALYDLAIVGLLLRTHFPARTVFVLAAANPSEAARIGLLSSVDPELSVLGPVGFWIATSLGRGRTLALAVAWPMLLGTGFVLAANHRLKRADLVC